MGGRPSVCYACFAYVLPIHGRNNGVPLGKTGTFAHPQQEKRLFVGQNKGFCPSEAGKTALRWAKQALLPIRGRKNSSPLGKTGTFAHPQQEKRLSVGQNRHFCPSTAGKTAFRWATRATAGREEGLPQSPPQRPRCSRRIAFTPAAVPCLPLVPSVPFFLPSPCLLPAFSLPSPCLLLAYPRLLLTFPPHSHRLRSTDPAKLALRAPKTALLVSRTRKTRLACPKNRLFGVPNSQNPPYVPQKQPFWCPESAKHASRWAKQALLPIRSRKNRVPLGKTGVFAHPRQEKTRSDGQNKGFCPSE